MGRTIKSLLVFLCAASLLLLSAVAVAQVPGGNGDKAIRLNKVGKECFDKGDFPCAMENFSKSYKLVPGNEVVRYYLAKTKVEIGDEISSKKHWESVLHGKLPDRVKKEARDALAGIFALEQSQQALNQKRFKEALATLRTAFNWRKKCADGAYLKGVGLAELGKVDEARKIGEEMKRYGPGRTRAKELGDKLLKFVENKRLEKVTVRIQIKTPGVSEPEVLLDGKTIPSTKHGADFRAKPGSRTLIVTKEGYNAHEEKLVLKLGKPISRVVTLKAMPAQLLLDVKDAKKVTVFLDGKERTRKSRATIGLTPGEHELKVVSESGSLYTEKIAVGPGEKLTRSVSLVAAPKGTSGYLITTYVTGGLGVALMGVGGAMFFLAKKDQETADDGGETQVAASDAWESAKKKRNAAYAMWGIGGACIATSIVFLVIDLTRSSPSQSARFGVGPGPGKMGVSFGMHF